MSGPSMAPVGFMLSQQQRRVWDAWGDGAAPGSRVRLRRPAHVSTTDLEARFAALVACHEILRTSFPECEGLKYPMQDVNTAGGAAAKLNVHDDFIEIECTPLCCDRRSLTLLAESMLSDASCAEDILQYADYAGWQSEWTGGSTDNAMERGQEFWSAEARRCDPDVTLPFAGRAGARCTPATVRRVISSGVLERLRQFAATLHVSTEAVLLALWQEHECGLTGSSSGIGVNLHGRFLPELEGAVGLYSRAVPFSSRLEVGGDFESAVRRTADGLVASQQWFHAFESPALSGTPWPIQFEYQRCALPELESISHTAEPFLLKLDCLEQDHQLTIEISYDSSALNSAQAGRIAEQFCEQVHTSVTGRPHRVIGSVPLGASEVQRLLDWHATDLADFSLEPFSRSVERIADVYPARAAVSCRDVTLTFAGLNCRANRLARLLRSQGVGSESRVAVCMRRDVQAIVAILAVLKAGGAYVPLDPAHGGAGRVNQTIKDSGACIVITDAPHAAIDHLGLTVIQVNRDRACIEAQSDTNLDVAIPLGSLAYVIYTSGSTGVPKGVMVSHESLAHLGHSLVRRIYTDGTELRIAVNAPLSFDSSVKQLVMLGHGASLHLISDEERTDPSCLLRRLRRDRVQVLDVTPSLLSLLLDYAAHDRSRLPETVLVGGEAVSAELWSRCSALNETRCVNLYGPTECTVDATAQDIGGAAPSIGKPLPNVRVYVLDKALELAPIGCPGELCIGGVGVARGYLDQAAATAERFCPDPYHPSPGARMYRTGDLARIAEDGSIIFLGRADAQVKVRGFRVEPGEVESVILRLPDIRAAAVIPFKKDDTSQIELVAFFQAPAALDPNFVLAALAAELPAFMVPSRCLRVDEMPRTSHGKLDRAELAQRASRSEAATADHPPTTPLESAIYEMWKDLLQRDGFGCRQSFFALGGHSLLVMQLAARLRNTYQLDLPLGKIFEEPTITGLAQMIERALADPSRSAAAGIQRAVRTLRVATPRTESHTAAR